MGRVYKIFDEEAEFWVSTDRIQICGENRCIPAVPVVVFDSIRNLPETEDKKVLEALKKAEEEGKKWVWGYLYLPIEEGKTSIAVSDAVELYRWIKKNFGGEGEYPLLVYSAVFSRLLSTPPILLLCNLKYPFLSIESSRAIRIGHTPEVCGDVVVLVDPEEAKKVFAGESLKHTILKSHRSIRDLAGYPPNLNTPDVVLGDLFLLEGKIVLL